MGWAMQRKSLAPLFISVYRLSGIRLRGLMRLILPAPAHHCALRRCRAGSAGGWSGRTKNSSRRPSSLHLHVLVALANLPAWVEDGGQQGVEIGPLVGGEIGADIAALVE